MRLLKYKKSLHSARSSARMDMKAFKSLMHCQRSSKYESKSGLYEYSYYADEAEFVGSDKSAGLSMERPAYDEARASSLKSQFVPASSPYDAWATCSNPFSPALESSCNAPLPGRYSALSWSDDESDDSGRSADEHVEGGEVVDREWYMSHEAEAIDEMVFEINPEAISQINGSHGEFTGTDDLEDEVVNNVTFGRAGTFVHLHMSLLERVGCDCHDDHYHVSEPQSLSKAHRRFMKSRKKREGVKECGATKENPKAKKMPKQVSHVVKFGIQRCGLTCSQRHLHVSSSHVTLVDKNMTPFFDDPIVDDEEVEVETDLGEKHKNAPHVGMQEPKTSDESDSGFDRGHFYTDEDDAQFYDEPRMLEVSDGTLVYGVFRLGVSRNGGVAEYDGRNVGNMCLLITVSELLRGRDEFVTPEVLMRTYFPSAVPGTMLEIGDGSKDQVGLIDLLAFYDARIVIWGEHVNSRGVSTGWHIIGGTGCGEEVWHIAMSGQHFEAVLSLCVRRRDLDQYDAHDHFLDSFVSVSSFVHTLKMPPASGLYWYDAKVPECGTEEPQWYFTRQSDKVRFWSSIAGVDRWNRPLSSALKFMIANGGNPSRVINTHIKEIISTEALTIHSKSKPIEPSETTSKEDAQLKEGSWLPSKFTSLDSLKLPGVLRALKTKALRIPEVLADTIGPLLTTKDFREVVRDTSGKYFDTVRIEKVMMNMSSVSQNSTSLYHYIQSYIHSFTRKPVSYALPEDSSGVQHSLKLNMHYESEPTLLWRILTLNFARPVLTRLPLATVNVLDGVYTSSMDAFIWSDLADRLLREASSIGSLATGEFWSWCVPRYKETVKQWSETYFSGSLSVRYDLHGHTVHSFNSITCNTLCYVIAIEAANSGRMALSVPKLLGTSRKGRSSYATGIFQGGFLVGGVDTYMGVIKASRLMSDGVAIQSGVLKRGGNYTIRSTYERRKAGLYSEGFTRILPMKCDKPLDWEFNNRFQVVGGKRFVSEGKIQFPRDRDEKLFDHMNYSHRYVSVYGFSFANSGMIYGANNDNYARMVERHWKVREPEEAEEMALKQYGVSLDGFDEKLLANQYYFSKYLVDQFVCQTRLAYGAFNYYTDIREASSLLILEPHDKQLLRIDAFENIQCTGEIGRPVFKPYLVWKEKMMEVAKPRKPPRVIVDAQTANSLPNVHISNAWKAHTADKVVIYGDCVSIEFCSCPRPKDLESVFKSWDFYSHEVVIKNYSDDSIIGLWNSSLGRYDMFNTDIRANDGSHSGWTWSVFSNLLGMPEDHSNFLLNLIFSDNHLLSRNKKHRVVFKAKYGYLPSGIGSTSIANNTAMLMIAWMISRYVKSGLELKLSLVTFAAYRCGFLLTFEPFDLRTQFSKMQFLKNSPVRLPSGGIMVIPNLGRMLRYSGRSKNDITIKQYAPPLVDGVQVNLFLWYQTLLTYGDFKRVFYKPLAVLCPYFHLVDSRHYSLISRIRDDLSHESLSCASERLYPSREQFYSRYIAYGATDTMIDEFEGLTAGSSLGSLVYCSMVDLVLFVDYGLSSVTV